MKIGFEMSGYVESMPTGVAVYIRNLLPKLESLNTQDEMELYYRISRVKHKKFWYKSDSLKTRVYNKSLLFSLRKPDIVHGFEARLPNWNDGKSIVTIHDIFPLIDRRSVISTTEFAEKVRRDVDAAIANSDVIITISDNTKRDVINHFQVSESKIVRIYPGLDEAIRNARPHPVSEKQAINRDYLLFIGAVCGRKNTAGIVEAFARSKAKHDFDLVLAGPISHNSERTFELIEHHGLEDRVKHIGYIDDDDRRSLYEGAKGLVFPTLYEGFGFPIIEAMYFGIPVLLSNVGAAPEIAGEFAEYVDPHDIDSIAAGIDRIAGLSDYDSEPARERAKEFDWNKTAKSVYQIYDRFREEVEGRRTRRVES